MRGGWAGSASSGAGAGLIDRDGNLLMVAGAFDLILLDLMMPELDGYATTEAIRRMPQFADLPIIAVTAKAMKGDREKTIAAGASDYITKPVDTGHLLGVMRSWLQRAGAR